MNKCNNAINTYNDVVSGVLKKFPKDFFNDTDNVIVIIKYLLEDKNNYNHNDIVDNFNTNFLRNNKLSWLLTKYEGSPFKILNLVYPNEFTQHELKVTCKKYYNNKDNRIETIKYIVEDMHKINDISDIPKKINSQMFAGILRYYDHSLFNLINEAYPDTFKSWEFNKVGNNFWKDINNRTDAVRWLGKRLNKAIDELTITDFNNNKLSTLMRRYYDSDINKMLLEMKD